MRLARFGTAGDGGLALLLAVTLAGLLNAVVKWAVRRAGQSKGVDPFDLHPLNLRASHGFNLLKDLSFPSGHACLAFAMAACLLRIAPRTAPVAFALAGITAAYRALEAPLPERCRRGGRLGMVAARIAQPLGGIVRLKPGLPIPVLGTNPVL